MACCAGIRLEATSVLLESQHPRAAAAAYALPKKRKRKRRWRNGASTVESIWIHGERFWLAATPSDHPRGRQASRRRIERTRRGTRTSWRNFEISKSRESSDISAATYLKEIKNWLDANISEAREKRKGQRDFFAGDQANLWSTCERQKLIWGMRKRKEKNRTKLRHEWSGRSRGTYLRTGGALDLWMPAQVPISIVSSFVSFHRYSYTVCRLK